MPEWNSKVPEKCRGGLPPTSPVHLWQQLPFLLLIQSLEFYTRTYRLMLSVQVLDGYENQRKNQTRWWTFLKVLLKS